MTEDERAALVELGRAAVDGIVLVDVADAAGRVTAVNDVAAALLGRSKSDLAGVPFTDVLASPALAHLRERPAGTRIDGILRGARGAEVPVHLWLRPVEHRQGVLAVILRDASEWEVARSTLSLIAAGVENAADAFEITDADGRIEYANGAHATLTGHSLFEAIGERLTRFVDDQSARDTIERALAAGAGWRGEVACVQKDGALRYHDLAITPVVDGHGGVRRFVSIRRDVTDRIELEREAEELRAELALAERTSIVGRLAASVAHEVNNPATSILANLEVARDEVDQIAREIEIARVSATTAQLEVLEDWWARLRIDERLGSLRETLSDSRDGTERVVHLVRDLRSLVRHESARSELLSLNDVVRAASRIARAHLSGRATLGVDLGPVPRVRADRRHLGQALMSILVNAAQSIEPGDEGRNHVSVRTFRSGDDVHVVVEDSGSGIRPEHLPRVFDPFFTEKPIGISGLGLAVSRDLIEAAGGEIRVESEGRGTRVIVSLPAAPEDHVSR